MVQFCLTELQSMKSSIEPKWRGSCMQNKEDCLRFEQDRVRVMLQKKEKRKKN